MIAVDFESLKMNQLKAPALLLIVFAIKVSSCFDRKFAMSVDERIENCADPKFDAKALDLSELELIAESDFEVFINGTAKFTREHRSSIPFQILAERFDRNQWHLSVMNTKRDDFCKSIHNLAELWGAKMMKFKGCPLKVGVRKALKL